MRHVVPALIAAVLALAAFADEAWAGQIIQSSGPVMVNGRAAAVPAKIGLNDVVDTGDSTVVIRSDAGDRITLDPRTVARGEGTEDGIEYIFVLSGVATADLSVKTTVGVSASWATCPLGMTCSVRVEAPPDRPGIEGRMRTTKGAAWLRNGAYSMWVPEAHSVTLWLDRSKREALCFRTSQQNQDKVMLTKLVSGGPINMDVPRATSGCVEELSGNRTKVSNDITSNKQDKIHIETEFGSRSTANVPPGTYAIIDNQTGAIELVDESFEDLDDAPIPTPPSPPSETKKDKR